MRRLKTNFNVITIGENTFLIERVHNDVNGNPKYEVHFIHNKNCEKYSIKGYFADNAEIARTILKNHDNEAIKGKKILKGETR